MLKQEQLIEIAIVIVGSLILGWLVKKIVFPFLYRLSRKTKWKSDDLIVESIGHWVIFWFFLGACFYTLPILVKAFSINNKLSIFLDNLLWSLFIFSTSWVIARVVAGMIQIRSKSDGSEIPSSSILGNIIKVIIYCLGFILILQTFGIAITPLVTALGVGGLAVALALQPTLSNLFSGLQIIASGKINIGDFVQLENGKKGFVRDITWRNTTIETGQNNIVIVPNSKMADSIVENFFLINKEITFHVEVRVSYDSDLEKVEKVSIETAKNVLQKSDGGIKDFSPVVLFYNFGEIGIDLKIFLRVKEYADQFMITSEFIKALQKNYKESGIKIPFPVRTVFLNNMPPSADS
jgi:small-conductance mechanosensitive channel